MIHYPGFWRNILIKWNLKPSLSSREYIIKHYKKRRSMVKQYSDTSRKNKEIDVLTEQIRKL